jgi:pimeloyl-ACP methyl ester carboxylesterase
MLPFALNLPDNGTVEGRASIPKTESNKPRKFVPLIVCLHGGSYDAKYFDSNEEHSIATVANFLNIPVISINRPGYGDSTRPPKPTVALGQTVPAGQSQGKYLNSVVLPALWKEFGSEATGMVLLSHSIGSMVATVTAGSYQGTEGYPLVGLITSGIGVEAVDDFRQGMIDLIEVYPDSIILDCAMKDVMMLNFPAQRLVDPEMCLNTVQLNNPLPSDELHDINVTWITYMHEYMEQIKVPVMYGIGEFDALWKSRKDLVDRYRLSFTSSPRVDGCVVPMAPHCIEVSHQSRSWLTRCCGFAIECTVRSGLLADAM